MRGLTVRKLNRGICRAFAEDGLGIPFPRRDVHLFKET